MRTAPNAITLDSEAQLYADLTLLDIRHAVEEHQAVFTVDESRALHDQLPGTHSKNLFLRDNVGQYWLVTVPAEIRVDLKALPAAIGSKRLSFAKAEDLLRLLSLTPGSVTPLGAINDKAGDVIIVLDQVIAHSETVWVHPLRNTASLGISGAELTLALQHWQHDPKVISVPRLTT